MACPGRDGSGDDAKADGSDQVDRVQGSEVSDESEEVEESQPSQGTNDVQRSDGLLGVSSVRIGDVLRNGPECIALVGREEVENGILLWLQALDLQVMGGCRSDERLKPLLKLDASSGAAEDQFMAQLVQHFEASEVAILTRCLCLPLVSVRVGKIIKQGNMLCPMPSRGFLTLTLLPSSHMRLSFTGDDGCTERLAVVSNDLESSSVIIKSILADTSGRSFLIKFSDSQSLFFWCSEKSKSNGMELIVKMKDLLGNKPTLSTLTGISESRLDAFATHLRAYIFSASTSTSAFPFSTGSLMTAAVFPSLKPDLGSQSMSPHIRIPASHTGKIHSVYQTSLSPRPNTFKEGTPRNCFTRNSTQEKARRRGDSPINSQPSTTPASSHDQSITIHFEVPIKPQNPGSHGLLLPTLSPLSAPLFSLSSTFSIPSKFNGQTSFYSPYYCWCPPCPTSGASTSNLLPLPPLPTLLSSAAPPESLIPAKYPLDVSNFPPLKLPSHLPDPLIHLSMPIVSSLCPLPSSQQIATFTPFLSDPIVHIPMIDVFSSGQGYFVNAGPSMSAAIPSLPISRATHHRVSSVESSAEMNARETLRMLMTSSPSLTAPQLFLGSVELHGNGSSQPGHGQAIVEPIGCDISSLELSFSACDISNDVLTDGMEECNCPNSNGCRTSNNEPDGM